MRKKLFMVMLVLTSMLFVNCGGGGGGSTSKSDAIQNNTGLANQKNTITGIVDDDIVEGAEVYIDFGDSNSTKATTNAKGEFTIKLTDDEVAIINPQLPDDVDGPKGGFFIVASKNGKVLRNAIDRNVSEGKALFITNDTEAYAQFLETVGTLDSNSLEEFNYEIYKGRIASDSVFYDFIQDFREDVKSYFYGGAKPDASIAFNKAYKKLDKSKLASIANSSISVPSSVMSGGELYLGEGNVTSDDISLTKLDSGRYVVGSGSDSTKTVYLKSQQDGLYKVIALNIASKTTSQIASQNVTAQDGATLGDVGSGIVAYVPPYAINDATQITLNKIQSSGETADGKIVLDMQPSGLNFEVPITVGIKYSDYGITDPYSASFEYGSSANGYELASVSAVDTTNGMIYLNITHFSNITVKSRGTERFLDLGPNFVAHIPARDRRKSIVPNLYGNNSAMIQSSSIIVGNKLFEGASISNLNGESTTGGGQCVQFAKNFYYPLQYNLRPNTTVGIQANKLLTNIDKTKNGFRASADKCQVGDIVAMSTIDNYTKDGKWYEGTGHVGIFYNITKDDKSGKYKVILINSNAFDSTTKKAILPNTGKPNFASERFSIANGAGGDKELAYQSDKMLKYDKAYTFACFGKEYFSDLAKLDDINSFKTIFTNEKADTTYNNTGGSSATWKPWSYYLVQDSNNGITQNGKQYTYDPMLLHVSPLKVSYDANNNGTIVSTKDARYEIYTSDEIKSFKFNGSDYKKDAAQNLTFNGVSLSKMYLLASDGTRKDQPMVSDGSASWYTGSSPELGKVLFSPTVIDDYYVSLGKANTQPDQNSLPIGFWNSHGYNLTYQGDYDGNIANLKTRSIYRQGADTVNGYFMTLGASGKASWHFALLGNHSIFVNLPTGTSNSLATKAKYTLYLNGSPVELQIDETNHGLNQTDFKNWYPLKNKANSATTFNFTGKDYVVIENLTTDTPVVVDALRLDASGDTIKMLKEVKGQTNLQNANDHASLKNKIRVTCGVKYVEKIVNFASQYTLSSSIPVNENIECTITHTPVSLTGASSTVTTNSLTRSATTVSPTDYKPQSQRVVFLAGQTSVNLPTVTLYKNVKKPSVKIRALNALNGSILADANIAVRYGTDRDDNTTAAFSGVTNSSGVFEMTNVPYGQYSVVLNKTGYVKTNLNLTVDANSAATTDLSLSPSLSAGQMRIRLTWGATPRDLDSHLVKKVGSTTEYHIYYGAKTGTNGDNLDLDDTTSYGPETVTVSSLNSSATYTYYVHNFSGDGTIKDSGSSVKVTTGNNEQTFYPPSEDGIYWKVFTISNGIITPCISGCIYSNDSTLRNINPDLTIFKNLPKK